jgi:hypothetical protein
MSKPSLKQMGFEAVQANETEGSPDAATLTLLGFAVSR